MAALSLCPCTLLRGAGSAVPAAAAGDGPVRAPDMCWPTRVLLGTSWPGKGSEGSVPPPTQPQSLINP